MSDTTSWRNFTKGRLDGAILKLLGDDIKIGQYGITDLVVEAGVQRTLVIITFEDGSKLRVQTEAKEKE